MRVVLYYTLSTEILLYRVLTVLLFLFFCLLRRLPLLSFFFFFNDTATPEIYTLSLHDALPIWVVSLSCPDVSTRCTVSRAVLLGIRSLPWFGKAPCPPSHNSALPPRVIREALPK